MIDDFTYPTTESRLIALQLGAVCINYGQIDHTLGALIGQNMKVAPAHWDIATSILDMSRKCELVKALSFLNESRIQYRRIEKALNFLDNPIRTKRNRYVHDSYSFWTGENTRKSMKTQIVNIQAFKKELRTAATATVTSQELAEFNKDLDAVAHFLSYVFIASKVDRSKVEAEALTALDTVGDEAYARLEETIARYNSTTNAT